jgi:sulfur-oxidizing protein SoxY
MPCNRRKFIKHSITLTAWSAASASNLLVSRQVSAEPAIAKPVASLLELTLKDLFKGSPITETDKIDLQIPIIAENGAVVPISVTSSLADVLNVFILVEKNPLPLSAKFALSPELEPFISARLKMAETSDVIVIADTGKALYSAKANVKVTIGGCGG